MNHDYASLKKIAYNFLARREHAIYELSQKLLRYTDDKVLISEVIHELKEQNFLNDARFAGLFISAKLNRGKGPERIQQELIQKGIATDIIENSFEPYIEEWLSAAEIVRRKKFGEEKPHDFLGCAKQMKFLQYRGFSIDIIKKVFRENLRDE